MPYILALDQGTSSSRAIIYDDHGEVVGSAQQTFETLIPADGWVEQDPEVLWQSIVDVGRAAIAETGVDPQDIAAMGITNQRETTLLWDKTSGECVYNAIVWQDRRGAQVCERMQETQYQSRAVGDLIADITGLLIDPYFSSTKLAWLLNEVDASPEELAFGTVDSFLIWRLTCGAAHCTDATNASRTQLFDIHEQQWSQTLLDFFAIPIGIMPQVRDSAGLFGVADPQWFGAAIPITGVAGDQQAAMVGQGCFSPGMTKSTYGTGCFVMMNTGSTAVKSSHRLLTTVGYRINGATTYALEGSIFVAGVAIQWLRDQLKVIEDVNEISAAYQRTQGDAGGVFVVPAFTGLGAPHWQPDVRGLITGLSLHSNRDHLLTAFLQSVVFQTQELFTSMAADGVTVERLRVDGGMVVNADLCQFLADILQVPVERPKNVETTAMGAAMLAGIGVGLFSGLDDAAQAWRLERRFASSMADARRETLLAGYAKAVAQALVS